MSLSSRVSVVKTSVNTNYSLWWYEYIPLVNIFVEGEHSYDIVTYDFESEGLGFFPIDGSPADNFGYFSMSLGQDVRQNFIIYHKTTIFDLLSSFGGQAIAIIGISGWLLSGYQQFLFEKSRL